MNQTRVGQGPLGTLRRSGSGRSTVRAKDERVEGGCDRALLAEGEDGLALVEVLVVQHQQGMRINPVAQLAMFQTA